MGVSCQGLEVGHAVPGNGTGEDPGPDQGGQGRQAAGTAAPDGQAGPVDEPVLGQGPGEGHAVVHVALAPRARQQVPVVPAVAGAAPVVDGGDGDPPAGEELDRRVVARFGGGRRATVAEHHQGRRCAVVDRHVGIRRGEEEAGYAVVAHHRRPGHRVRRPIRWCLDGRRSRQPLRRARPVEGHGEHGVGLGRGRAVDHHRGGVGPDHAGQGDARLVHPGAGPRAGVRTRRRRAQHDEPVPAPRAHAGRQRAVGALVEGVEPEDPVGPVELLFRPRVHQRHHRHRRLPRVGPGPRGHAVGQPPPGPVVDEDQAPVGHPPGLTDRHPVPTGHLGDRTELESVGAFGQRGHDQARRVPRHVRVAPGAPGQPSTVGGRPGCGHEPAPVDQDDGRRRPVGGDGHHPVHGGGARHLLLHGHQPPAVGGRPPVGVAHRARPGRGQPHGVPGRSDGCAGGSGGRSDVDPVPVLVVLVHVVQDAVGHGGRPSPVLVHPAADTDPRRRHIGPYHGDVRPRIDPHHDLATTFAGPGLGPVHPTPVGLQTGPGHLAGGHLGGGPRGRPPSGPGGGRGV